MSFEDHRGYLFGVAYRMLGTVADAEDAVQEAWLRWQRTDRTQIREERAWLTTVVGRISLDLLGSARVRREQYVGPWLPEPLLADRAPGAGPAGGIDPAERVTLDESVGMALLVVLETLSPAERTAFVLHEVFGIPFDEVAQVVGRSPEAVRQLASRARRHVQDRAPRFDPDAEQQRRVAETFRVAAAGGDLAALVRTLDPDVVLHADGGGVVTAARRPIVGADAVARFLLGVRDKGGDLVSIRPVTVNDGPGYVVETTERHPFVVALTVGGGRVTAIHLVLNPDKLTRL